MATTSLSLPPDREDTIHDLANAITVVLLTCELAVLKQRPLSGEPLERVHQAAQKIQLLYEQLFSQT